MACPSIAQQALQLALAHIYRLRDPSLISSVISAYESVASSQAGISAGLLPVGDVVQVDIPWLEEVTKQNTAERTKLEVELKTYTNNMIKESIRVSLLRILFIFLTNIVHCALMAWAGHRWATVTLATFSARQESIQQR